MTKKKKCFFFFCIVSFKEEDTANEIEMKWEKQSESCMNIAVVVQLYYGDDIDDGIMGVCMYV